MSKQKKSKKQGSNGKQGTNGRLFASAGRFTSRNARSIGLAGLGALAGAAAVLLGQRYGAREAGDAWDDEDAAGTIA